MTPRPSVATVASLLILAVAIVIGVVLLLASRPEPVHITINPPAPTNAPQPTGTPAPIAIYVTGAVNQPGALVVLAAGSRIGDAIQAAGGAAADADLERVNLAAALRDGDHVHVSRQGEIALAVEAADQAGASGSVIHVNRATQAELETLPGIGPVLAQRIIAYREANGAFASLEALTAVSGIGEHIAASLDGLVAFD